MGEVQGECAQLGGYEVRAQAVLAGLGFSGEEVVGDVPNLAGGLRMRVSIAQIVLSCPEVMLLD